MYRLVFGVFELIASVDEVKLSRKIPTPLRASHSISERRMSAFFNLCVPCDVIESVLMIKGTVAARHVPSSRERTPQKERSSISSASMQKQLLCVIYEYLLRRLARMTPTIRALAISGRL